MDFNKMAHEIHQNAVEHGWWEDERSAAEVRALIHSEWSEALEEARAGRPMEWYMCGLCVPAHAACTIDVECPFKDKVGFDRCPVRKNKPEGIAVELIDGVIRILDLLGKEEFDFGTVSVKARFTKKVTLPELIDALHFETARKSRAGLINCICVVFKWLKLNGVDPEAVLLRKHEYNKTRPYKHGKKF